MNNYANLKIGKLVQTVLKPLLISKATPQEVLQMQGLEYSKENFGIQYPLLLKTTSPVTEKHYYSDLFLLYGETYRLCCEWYETPVNNDRPFVEKWIREHEGAESTIGVKVVQQEVKRELVEDFSDLYEAFGNFGNKTEVSVDLHKVMADMDPVAFHSEYYFGIKKGERTLLNGKWLFVYPYGSQPYMMDENGGNKVELNIENRYVPVGMNHRGIWFMDCNSSTYAWDETEWWNRFICFYPPTGEERTIKFNNSKASLGAIYIYDTTIYYVGKMPGGSDKLVKVDAAGTETVLYRTHKGESIGRICADDKRVVFEISDENMSGSYYCIMDTNGWNPEFIGKKRDPKNDWFPFIEIMLVDLKYNIMWTTLTEAERIACEASEQDWVARPLGEPEEFRYLTCTNAPELFKNAGAHDGKYYFDGIDKYVAPSYSRLYRVDEDGNKQELSDGSGHGETETFLVNSDYIFVNYDAQGAVSLPRKFQGRTVEGYSNPEAKLIFRDNYRL